MDGAQPVDRAEAGPIVDPNPGRLEAWFHDARFWLWVPGLTAVAIALGFLGELVVPDICWSSFRTRPAGCDTREDIQGNVYVLAIGAGIAAGAVLALWLGRSTGYWFRRRRRKDLQPRISQAKEWFLRADLDEGEYLALEAALKSQFDGSAPGPRRRAAGVAIVLVAICSGFVALGFGIAVLDMMDYSGPGRPLLGVLAIAVTFGGASGLGTVQGVRLLAQSKTLTRRGLQDLERIEFDVLRRARGRKTGTRVAVVASGPSFQSWR